jgi:hypothetical protein
VRDSTYKAIIALVGMIFMALMAMEAGDLAVAGRNDFAPFYVGAQLIGTGDLYAVEPYYAFLMHRFDGTNDSLRYTRLPHHALMFWPLGRLPYETAYVIWTVLRIAAVIGFLLLWKIPGRWDAIAFTALSLPLATAMLNGQDIPFLLLWIALAVHWHEKEKPFLVGLILSLCAAKFHLFVLLPLVFIGQRRWKMFNGFATGGAALLAATFLTEGWSWPGRYFATLTDGRVHPAAFKMPNLHGLFDGLVYSTELEIVLGVAVVAGAWYVIRRTSFLYGLAAALFGGVLLSYHAYLADCTILLPAMLIVCSLTSNRKIRVLGAVLLTPAFYLCLLTPRPAPYLVQTAILLFLFSMVLETMQQQAPATDERPATLLDRARPLLAGR